MRRFLLSLLALVAIPCPARAEGEAAQDKASAPSLEARVEAAAAKVAALADAMKRLAGAKECERAEILAELKRAFADAGRAPVSITTIESRHEVRKIEEAAAPAPAPAESPTAEEVKRLKDERDRAVRETERQKKRVEELQDLAESTLKRLMESTEETERLRSESRELKAVLEDLKKRHLELARKWAEHLREHERDGGYDHAPPPQETLAIPKIDGRVVGVSQKINLLVISVGEEDGVKVGFEFTIYRGTTYVGKMVVERVYPRQSAGRVIPEKTKDRVQPGDCVTTQVF
jgi:hypothetical protein